MSRFLVFAALFVACVVVMAAPAYAAAVNGTANIYVWYPSDSCKSEDELLTANFTASYASEDNVCKTVQSLGDQYFMTNIYCAAGGYPTGYLCLSSVENCEISSNCLNIDAEGGWDLVNCMRRFSVPGGGNITFVATCEQPVPVSPPVDAPVAPTAPEAPTAPTTPTAPTAPVAPSTPTAPTPNTAAVVSVAFGSAIFAVASIALLL